MAKYLKVSIEGPVIGSDVTHYEKLDGLTGYTEKDLDQIAADVVANYYSYGGSVVDESEVPEGDR